MLSLTTTRRSLLLPLRTRCTPLQPLHCTASSTTATQPQQQQHRTLSSSSSSSSPPPSSSSSSLMTSSKRKTKKRSKKATTSRHQQHHQVTTEMEEETLEDSFNRVGRFREPYDTGHPFFTPNRVEIGNVSRRTVHIPDTVPKPQYHRTGDNSYHMLVDYKTPDQIEQMREACRLARQALQYALAQVTEGITTEEIDRRVTEFILQHGAYPSPLNYGHFPKSICTSVNEVMVHGIPDDRPLQFGDMINIDVTVYYRGFHGDCSETTIVGLEDEMRCKEINPLHLHLMETTRQSLYAAIDICGPGVPFNRIGDAVETVVEKQCLELQKSRREELAGRVVKYSVSQDFCGHGIGQFFHGYPQIIHSRNNFGSDMIGARRMQPGMTFTIEPILCGGSNRWVMMPDKWTAISADRCINSQFEHTVLITQDGVEVLTVDEKAELGTPLSNARQQQQQRGNKENT